MFVVTGGPGSGKSSPINAMTRRGFRTMPEAGRAITQDQVRIGGPALPWADQIAFSELMLGWELRSYRDALEINAPVGFHAELSRTCPEEVESESLTFDRISPYDEHEEEFTRPPRQVHRCFQS
ncbi:AAA family ATPase [Agrobacterium vitis]|nr:AAA family ATPase [Agrobacterium vitis]UJL90670.1 AAA family ATPase [Agrobacterium vitis]